jgi:hypothetical protein
MPNFLTFRLLANLIFVLAIPAFQGDRSPRAEAEQEKIDKKALEVFVTSLRTEPHRDLKRIVIIRHGRLIAKPYSNGDDANTLHDTRSATKALPLR